MSQAASNASSLVGQRMGKYQLVALVARGGTAEIYLARIAGVAGFEKYVVVKLLHDYLADDGEFVRMFLDEARLTAQLDHSNIVQTLELGEEGGRYYIVMEYLAGMSLSLIARRVVERVPGRRLPVELVLGLAAQACAGLHYAHGKTDSSGRPLNVVHRDVSPQNLVVSFEGIVKLVDFGIAKADMRASHTRTGTIKGKFAYMSPEQCQSSEVDHRTDVFALGIIVHELLTGQRLFKRPSTYETYRAIVDGKVPAPSQVNHELDPALDEVVMKALTHDREGRYPSAEAFGEAMTAMLHRRGKLVTAGTVAAFFERHFAKEIDEHAERMRELVAGRKTVMDELWDDEAEISDGANGDFDDVLPQDGPNALSGLEVAIQSATGIPGLRRSGVESDELDVAATRVELPSEDVAATRVELPSDDVAATRVELPPEDVAATRVELPPEDVDDPGGYGADAETGDFSSRAGASGAGNARGRSEDSAAAPPSRAGSALAGVPTRALQVSPSGRRTAAPSAAIVPPPGDVAAGADASGSTPRPPVVATSLDGPRGRRDAAPDDFSGEAMRTEPAGPRGLMAARGAPRQQQDTEPVGHLVLGNSAPVPAASAAPGGDSGPRRHHAGAAGPPGVHDARPAPGLAAPRQSSVHRAVSGERSDPVALPLERPRVLHDPSAGRRQTALRSSVFRAAAAPRDPDTPPLWFLVLTFVVCLGFGLGVTLLVARLF